MHSLFDFSYLIITQERNFHVYSSGKVQSLGVQRVHRHSWGHETTIGLNVIFSLMTRFLCAQWYLIHIMDAYDRKFLAKIVFEI